jgi:hypothetical protein
LKKRTLIGLIVLVAIITAGLILWSQRKWFFDEIRLYNYKAPTQIATLASQDTMTPYGKKLFYIYHPVLENSTQFNSNCSVTEEAIVLGCTVLNQGIYLYNVQSSDLNGVEQVTAAHEMLHVAYDHLSSSERKKVDGMVWAAYSSLSKSNSLLSTEEASYLKTEGASAVPNELHSVLGTEIAKLPSALESYYSQYFTNRQAIVSYANSYEGEFLSRQQTIAKDDQQLATWLQQIGQDESQLKTENQQINQEQQQLDSLKSSGQIASYNSMVASFNQSVDDYNSLLNTAKQLLASYNQLVIQRNSVAATENQLTKAISSLPSTLSTH